MTEEHKQGRPWTTEATFNTFEEADKKRKSILAEEEQAQVKVRRTALDRFAVKARYPEQPKTKKKKGRKKKK